MLYLALLWLRQYISNESLVVVANLQIIFALVFANIRKTLIICLATSKLIMFRHHYLLPALFLLLFLSPVVGLYFYNQSVIQDSVSRMKHIVVQDFQDPDSARFKNLQLKSFQWSIFKRITTFRVAGPNSKYVESLSELLTYDPMLMELCGEVNGKNVFGAYVGYKAFYLLGNELTAAIDSDESDQFAKKICDSSRLYLISATP